MYEGICCSYRSIHARSPLCSETNGENKQSGCYSHTHRFICTRTCQSKSSVIQIIGQTHATLGSIFWKRSQFAEKNRTNLRTIQTEIARSAIIEN